MSISRLSPSSTLRLRAGVLLIVPENAVKELVDNAFDSGATCIEVTISANTIDLIRVRDNGSGISPADYNSLGRRSYTSKLRSFEELSYKAGETLGFRGEALACMNNSSEIVIITRTQQDDIAARLVLDSGEGGIADQKPVSAPVGTTVELSGLHQAMPVRRKECIRHAAKAITTIKNQLQAYAMARPNIKVIFTVLGCDLPKWIHVPTRASSAKETIIQLFGVDLNAQCVMMTGSANTVDSGVCSMRDDVGSEQPPGYTIQAFLPRPEADPVKVSGKGVFISVDSRPVNPVKGSFRKLVDIFKDYRKRCNLPSLRAPFLQLSIRCPSGAYDVNVSAAKDEIIFADETPLLKLFAQLCHELFLKDLDITEKQAGTSTLSHLDSEMPPFPGHSYCSDEYELIKASTDGPETRVVAVAEPGATACNTSHHTLSENQRLTAALDRTMPVTNSPNVGTIFLGPDSQHRVLLQSDEQLMENLCSNLRGYLVDTINILSTEDNAEATAINLSKWPNDDDGPLRHPNGTSSEGRNPWSIADGLSQRSRLNSTEQVTDVLPPESGSPEHSFGTPQQDVTCSKGIIQNPSFESNVLVYKPIVEKHWPFKDQYLTQVSPRLSTKSIEVACDRDSSLTAHQLNISRFQRGLGVKDKVVQQRQPTASKYENNKRPRVASLGNKHFENLDVRISPATSGALALNTPPRSLSRTELDGDALHSKRTMARIMKTNQDHLLGEYSPSTISSHGSFDLYDSSLTPLHNTRADRRRLCTEPTTVGARPYVRPPTKDSGAADKIFGTDGLREDLPEAGQAKWHGTVLEEPQGYFRVSQARRSTSRRSNKRRRSTTPPRRRRASSRKDSRRLPLERPSNDAQKRRVQQCAINMTALEALNITLSPHDAYIATGTLFPLDVSTSAAEVKDMERVLVELLKM